MKAGESSNHQSAFLLDGLSLITLWGFAVAQPLYDLFARNPAFFVAHNSDERIIFLFTFLLANRTPQKFLIGASERKRKRMCRSLILP